MPLTKIPKKREPLWKEWNHNADKRGVRNTFYSVNGDQYTGEWENNKKNGKKFSSVLVTVVRLVVSPAGKWGSQLIIIVFHRCFPWFGHVCRCGQTRRRFF